jgi:NhaP-type Na+/H+ or K+/H+ antiporter
VYSEYRYVQADATFKNALLLVGAIAAPFVLLTVPREHAVDAGTLLGFILVLALLGALAGTVIGYGVDRALARFRTPADQREVVYR